MRIFILFLLGVASASAQDFFPAEVGNRWIYAVEGTTVSGDTLDALIQWTIQEMRSSEDLDSVWVDVRRLDRPTGILTESRCVVELPVNEPYLMRTVSVGDGCRASGGFPFGVEYRTAYPFLLGPRDTLQTVTVDIGGQPVTGTTAEGWFSGQNVETRPTPVNTGTDVRAVLLAGVGLVELTVKEYNVGGPVAHRDSLRSRLRGAEIGGQVYGDARAVAAAPSPTVGSLAIRVGPTPTHGPVTVWVSERSGGPVRIRVVDVLGRVLVETVTRSSGPVRLDLSGARAGVYHVWAEDGSTRAVTPVVLVR